ncbi:transglutaminase [Pseudohoeflea suaedae]|uniref:Transglutaminase n=1 Tax=Pseudohoeflea suaedae TaxID=877384 RepID=A0A4R5PHT4_9HYPH|nr:transglutaminase-like cysteine peptidase [Pseudohoeflea suaedae]TDH34486.1 transglutaminase [Pseudohoeflea suaedae]
MNKKSTVNRLATISFGLAVTLSALTGSAAAGSATGTAGGALAYAPGGAGLATAVNAVGYLFAYAREFGSAALAEPGIDGIVTGGTASGGAAISSGVFASIAIPFFNGASQGKWVRVKSSFAASVDCGSEDCRIRNSYFKKSVPSKYNGKNYFKVLDAVNRSVNRGLRYSPDSQTYNKVDYWATPSEILTKGAGDCEDFAILKYHLLVKAGIPASSLSLVVLKDTSRKLYHSVLAVGTNKGFFILDNVVDRIYRDADMPQYMPLISFSTDRAWIHGVESAGEQRLARSEPVDLAAIAPGVNYEGNVMFEDLPAEMIENLRPREDL